MDCEVQIVFFFLELVIFRLRMIFFKVMKIQKFLRELFLIPTLRDLLYQIVTLQQLDQYLLLVLPDKQWLPFGLKEKT